jgi:hypothetical protein
MSGTWAKNHVRLTFGGGNRNDALLAFPLFGYKKDPELDDSG